MSRFASILFMLFAFLFGTVGRASGFCNYESPAMHSGDFLLWESDASTQFPLKLADPTREIRVWIYDEALGVPVDVRQNPWTFYDPIGLWMQPLGNWLGERWQAPQSVRSMAAPTDTVVGARQGTLMVASAVPVLGMAADGVSATISAAEGKYGEATLTLTAGKAVAVAGKGIKASVGVVGAIASKTDDAARLAAASSAKATQKASSEGVEAVAPKKTVSNPVDLTDFRKDHILNRHKAEAGKSGKTEFPADWDDSKVLHEISDIATDPKSTVTPGRWGADRIQGTRDGIDITVDLYPSNSKHTGKISTAYPTNIPANP